MVPVARCGVNGRILEVNDAYVRMIGYGREELLNDISWIDLTPPEFLPLDEVAIESIIKTGKALPWEKEYIHKDGHRIPVLLGVSALDPAGEDCFCVIIDLTELKAKEAALRRSEAQFRTLIESIPQIVFISNENKELEYINHKWFEFNGLEPGQEDQWPTVVHPDDLDRLMQDIDATTEAGTPMEIEVRHWSKEGRYRWGLVRSLPMIDADGRVLRFGTCTDIDDTKQAEHELRESEAELRTLADAIPQIVWTADANGEIDFFNQRWFEATGLTLEQSLNDGWQLLIHPDDLPRYLKEWQHALTTGDTYEVEFRLRSAIGAKNGKNPTYRLHLGRGVAMRSPDGAITKWFATWTEIESQKKK